LIRLFAGYGERRTHGDLTFIACRQRYIDDFLTKRLEAGPTQVVILDAGLDSRAYRPEVRNVRFFEVDHPATQSGKIEKIRRILGHAPSNVTYVPVDFDTESLDKLLTQGFDTKARTVFIWEGVTQYLTEFGIDTTLAWVRTNAASGSWIIFDYQHGLPHHSGRLGSLMSRISGEQRAFDIPEEAISTFLQDRGFSSIVNVGPNSDRSVPDTYSIVWAEIQHGGGITSRCS
jgi:methyltransferase (TIGR00027 family)